MSSRLRVLIMTGCYPVDHSPADGIFVRTQAEALVEAGCEVEVFSPRPWVPPGFKFLSKKWRGYAKTPVCYELNGIPVFRPRFFAPPRANVWLSPHRKIAQMAWQIRCRQYDVVHAHFAYPDGLAGIQVARQWNLPSVLTLHGDDTNVHPLRGARALHRFCAAVSGADTVIAVSSALARRAESLCGRRPISLSIGVNLKKFTGLPDQAEARRLLDLPQGPLVLYVGRLLETKGIRELLSVVAKTRIKELKAIFIGAGPMAPAIGKLPNCQVAGVQPNERIPLYMRAADLLVLPSYSEGLPTVLVEAGAVGLPVVASTVGGVPELITEDRGYLVPAKCVASLLDAVERALSHPLDAKCKSAALRNIIMKDYDAVSNARKLVELYGELRLTKNRN